MTAHGGGPIGSLTITDSNTEIAPVDRLRRYFLIRNTGSSTLFIAIGVDAEANKGIPIYPSEYYEILGENMTNNYINGICSSGESTTITYQLGR